MCTSQGMRNLFTTSQWREVHSHSQESRSSCVAFNCEDKHQNSFCSPFFPVAFIMKYDAIWCETSLWSAGVRCQDCRPFSPLCIPILLALVLCKHCSALTKTSPHSQHRFGCKPKMKHHGSYYGENSLHSKTKISVYHAVFPQFWQMSCNPLFE